MKFNNFLESLVEYVVGGNRSPQKYDKSEEAENAQKSALQTTYSSGMRIVVSVHAGSQAKVRRSDLETRDWRTILKRFTKELKGKKEGEYLLYSKEYEQGIVLAYYPKNKLVRLITTLPKGRGNPKPNTKKLMVEELQCEYEVIDVD